jgi:hypothetical protein
MLSRIILAVLLVNQARSFCVLGRSRLPTRLLLEQSDEWKGFNPLRSTGGGMKNQILMRKTQMLELTQELMRNINDDTKIQEIIEDSKDFLLDPLENEFAVVDPDSIYDPGMTRAERYIRYRETMDERIINAKNGSIKKMLQSMKDYVLNYE